MKRTMTRSMLVASAAALIVTGTALADEHEEEKEWVANPIEMYACNYNEGKDQDDYNAVVKKFNDWADDAGLTEYSAWQLVPFYFGAEQDFDFIWLGASPSAASMGADQDKWFATGGKVQAEFDAVAPCSQHVNFAVLQYKEPAERQTPDSLAVSFSDCNMKDGVNFGEIHDSLAAWSEFSSENGSTAGMWVFFPAMGGGGEEFDFKWVSAHDNMEEHGKDWDLYSRSGWEKAEELFAGKLECDSSRVYIATSLRRAEPDDE